MIISLINTKGGVGKTTTAIALSEIAGENTLLVDASQESNLTAFCRVDPATARKHNIETWIRKADKHAVVHVNGKRIIPATVQTAADTLRLHDLPQYPLTIIDTQPTLSGFVRSIAKLSDAIIIPCDMDLYSVESAKMVMTQVGDGKRVWILPTKYRRLNRVDRALLKLMREKLDGQVLRPIRYDTRANQISFTGEFCNAGLLSDYRKSFNGVIL